MAQYNQVLRDPARRDPRVFVISADQADFPTATKFINALRYIGVEVHQASAALSAGGKNYPAGSYVVKTAQAGRAHVLDMFEPQDHPNDMDERGIPRRPYDSAGWTLAYQMGIKFDRHFDDVTGALTEIQGLAKPVPGTMRGTDTAGYLISPSINDAFTIANRVLKANGEVFRTGAPMTANGKAYPVGSFYVVASAASTPIVQAAAKELGVNVDATSGRPDAGATKLAAKRIALWDSQTGSMPSGWTRFMLERFEFPYTIVCGAGFDDSNLRSKYDVIIMPSGAAFRAGGGGGRGGGGGGGGGGGATTPTTPPSDPDLRSLCQVTTGTGTGATAEANVRKFVEAGGVVVAAGSAAESIALTLQLPVSDYLTERQPGQPERGLGSDKFYVPGSIVRVAVDPTAPSAAGSEEHSTCSSTTARSSASRRTPPPWHPPGDVVRLGIPAAQWLGVGTELPRRRHHRIRSDGRAGTRVCVWTGDHVPRAAARHVQVPVQRDPHSRSCGRRDRHRLAVAAIRGSLFVGRVFRPGLFLLMPRAVSGPRLTYADGRYSVK